jgi:diguanylate cyclase (GGDEF)-like protein
MTVDTVAARPYHVLAALALASLLTLAAVLTLPHLHQPWGMRPWVQGVYLACVFVLDSEIALFLALQVVAGAPTRSLAWLAGGYAFGATTAVGMFFSFPGLVSDAAADHLGGTQVSAWLWVLWHLAFPGFVLLALGARAKVGPGPGMPSENQRLVNLLPLAGGLSVALVVVAVCLHFPELLPAFVAENDYSRLSRSHVAAAVVGMNVLALAATIYVTRLREVLYVWLAFSMLAMLLDVLLSLAGSARYTAGWYMGRLVGTLSSAGLMVGLMVEHFKLHRDAEIRAAYHEQAASHDPLTGLFNRRYLADKLPEELGRAHRYRYPVSVLLLDLDHFKRINDRYGHHGGDDCLRALARVLGTRVHRFGDFTVRYGGEEFVVVLPETGLEGALEVAEEIRRQVEALRAENLPCPMTVSIGAATAASAETLSADELLARADKGLYLAKEQGRNRVAWLAPPPVAAMAEEAGMPA